MLTTVLCAAALVLVPTAPTAHAQLAEARCARPPCAAAEGDAWDKFDVAFQKGGMSIRVREGAIGPVRRDDVSVLWTFSHYIKKSIPVNPRARVSSPTRIFPWMRTRVHSVLASSA